MCPNCHTIHDPDEQCNEKKDENVEGEEELGPIDLVLSLFLSFFFTTLLHRNPFLSLNGHSSIK